MNDELFSTREQIETFTYLVRKKMEYRKDFDYIGKEFEKFLLRCQEADEKLTEMVHTRISKDYTSIVHIPIHEEEILLQFDFALVNEKDEDITRREEIQYQELCNICFGEIQPFFYTVWNYYEQQAKP